MNSPRLCLALVLASTLPAQTCRLLADLARGGSPSAPNELSPVFGDTLLFAAAGDRIGQEPWVSRAGGRPVLLKNIHLTGHSFPRLFVECGRLVFFTADDGIHGRELWVTNLTSAGTRLVKDIRPGRTSNDIRSIACVGDRVVFDANNGTQGREIWVSDGTAAGTVLLKDIRPGPTGSTPSPIVTCAGRAYFGANDGSRGSELWTSDGTASGTRLVKDLNPGAPGSTPSNLYCHRGLLYFRARGAQLGYELWQSDGSVNGTVLVKDINAGGGDSNPRNFATCGTKLFFVAQTLTTGAELFVHDAGGTRLVKNIRPGGFSSSPANLTCCDGTLFFAATDGSTGFELWKSNGLASGTVLVKDIRPGTASGGPGDLVSVGARLYFRATDSKAVGLWTSDGSTAGTRRICSRVATPRGMTLSGCRIFFSGYEAATSHEPYVIDAPGASAAPFGVGCGPRTPTMTSSPPRLGGVARIAGTNGPGNSVGLVLLDVLPRGRIPLPGGCSGYVQPTLVLGAVATATWALPLPIPNDGGLEGVCAPVQTWWITVGTVVPIRTTNGVMLGLGR